MERSDRREPWPMTFVGQGGLLRRSVLQRRRFRWCWNGARHGIPIRCHASLSGEVPVTACGVAQPKRAVATERVRHQGHSLAKEPVRPWGCSRGPRRTPPSAGSPPDQWERPRRAGPVRVRCVRAGREGAAARGGGACGLVAEVVIRERARAGSSLAGGSAAPFLGMCGESSLVDLLGVAAYEASDLEYSWCVVDRGADG